MKNLKLYENFGKDWKLEMSDYIKSDRRDLERDADNISKSDIDDVISGFDTKYKSTGDWVEKFRFIGSHFGMEDDEIEELIGNQE